MGEANEIHFNWEVHCIYVYERERKTKREKVYIDREEASMSLALHIYKGKEFGYSLVASLDL